MALTITHSKVNNIADWTEHDIRNKILDGTLPPGTTLADITLPSDWNDDHALSGSLAASEIDNDSSVTGTTVKDALETLAASGSSLDYSTVLYIQVFS